VISGTQPPPVTPPVTPTDPSGVIGSGSDTIVVKLSSDPDGPVGNAGRWAQFTLNVDGKQIGGLQTVAADRAKGETQTFTFKGNFGPGAHKVTVTFANNSMTQGDKAAFNTGGDRNLYVNELTYNGTKVTTGVKGIYESPWYPPESNDGVLHPGNAVFTVNDTTAVPAGAPSTPTTTPTPVSAGSGPDKLVLKMAEDPFEGDAQFTVKVDGKQIGGTFTTTAVQWQGQEQEFNLFGAFGTGAHKVDVTFVNDHAKLNSNGMGWDHMDRNLFINSISLNGGQATTPWEIPQNGTKSFTVTAGTQAAQPPQQAPVTPSVAQEGSITVTAAGHQTVLSGETVGKVTVAGDAIKLVRPGVADIMIGTQATKLEFVGMDRIQLTGGLGATKVTADGGSNIFESGEGAMDIAGGMGADIFHYGAGDARMTISGFNMAQGDALQMDKALQGSMTVGSDGQGGTLLTFGAAGGGGVNLKGVETMPVDAVRWQA